MALMTLLGVLALLVCAGAENNVNQKMRKVRGLSYHGCTGIHNTNSGYASDGYEGSGDGAIITNTIEVPVPQPYAVTVDRPIAVPVSVPVARPYPVEVPRPYPVTVERPVPITVNRPIPVPVRVPINVPIVERVEIPVPRPYLVSVDRPYTVQVPQPIVIERQVPVYINQEFSNEESESNTYGSDAFNANYNTDVPIRHSSLESSGDFHGHNFNIDISKFYSGHSFNPKVTANQHTVHHSL